jgi:acetyltransferase-like isoleucine patch superfamily enzyme
MISNKEGQELRIWSLLFAHSNTTEPEFKALLKICDRKTMRWLGAHHPDNRMRRWCFEASGVSIGEGSVINSGFIVSDGYKPLVTIGKRVAISPNVVIIAQSGPNNSLLVNNQYVFENLVTEAPVVVQDDSWLGSGVILLPGVNIGAGSVIGAGAIVTTDIPPATIAAGNPARIIRTLDVQTRIKGGRHDEF